MAAHESEFPHGGILCDEMGLGKTIQILGLMKAQRVGATLLIAPLCTLHQWEETAQKCGFQVWRHKGDAWEPVGSLQPTRIQIYVINYEAAVRRRSLVHSRKWGRVVWDEAHRMSKFTGQAYQMAKKIQTEYKWLLTATPIVNDVKDAVSLFSLLGISVPGRLKELLPYAEKHVLSRKMADLRKILPELPAAATEETHVLPFATQDEAEFYRGIQGVIQRRWRALQHEEGGQVEIFRLIMRLRQISLHPQVYIGARKKEFADYSRPDWTEPSTKFVALKEKILAEAQKPHRWLVFCHFITEMEMLKAYLLQECPVVNECHIYNGTLSQGTKKEVLEASKEPLQGCQQEILLVQLQSGGVGLNLQHCDRIAFMGPWWTSALMEQAIGRAVRIGQKEQVRVHHFILQEEQTMNIDKKMLDAAEGKRYLCGAFLEAAAHNGVEHFPTTL